MYLKSKSLVDAIVHTCKNAPINALVFLIYGVIATFVGILI